MNSLLHSAKFKNSLLACCTLAAIFGIAVSGQPVTREQELPQVRATRESPPTNPETNTPRRTQFIAVGDIMLSRTVADKMHQHGFSYPFATTQEKFQEVDFVFGNLETPITDGPRIEAGQMIFRADPGVEAAMRDANIQVVSLANNHTMNFGTKGLLDTFTYLEQADIRYAGAGRTASEARQPVVLESQGIRIAFLAYTDTDVVPDSYAATDERTGISFMDAAAMIQDIEIANSLADLVIVSMHSGTEYAAQPNIHQTSFARAAIDAGAELVIGHHPHVVQTIEEYKGKLIIYSLGNFIFDQMWSIETRQGMLATINCSADAIESIRFVPVMIDDYSQARLANEEEVQLILKRLGTAVILDQDFRWNSIDF